VGAVTGLIRRQALALLAVLAVAAAGSADSVLATPVRAASRVDFAAITATATFGQGIDVSEKVVLPDLIRRIEVLVRTESSDSSDVADVSPTPTGGSTTLAYHLAAPGGAIIPNTLLHFRFRVTLNDGSIEVGPDASVRYEDTRFAWKSLTGTIVRVHWVQGDDTFGRRALSIGDKAVADASQLLGVTETDPVDFFIYPDATSFRDVLGPATRENVGGVAFPDIRTLLADIAPGQVDDPWVGIVVPHELTHLVFGTATENPYHSPPHWLNEGLAVYLSQGFDDSDRSAVHDAAGSGVLMPLPALSGQFPTAGDRFGLAYAESVSAVDFMVRTYGKPALVGLIRSYAGGRTDDEAFRAALGVDVAGFEAAWVADLGAAEPSPVGPRPAPAGNVPADWGGPAATAGGAAGPTGTGLGPSGEASATDLLRAGLVTAVIVIAVIAFVAYAMGRSRRARSVGPPSEGGSGPPRAP
jgi:hypothetical protein